MSADFLVFLSWQYAVLTRERSLSNTQATGCLSCSPLSKGQGQVPVSDLGEGNQQAKWVLKLFSEEVPYQSGEFCVMFPIPLLPAIVIGFSVARPAAWPGKAR